MYTYSQSPQPSAFPPGLEEQIVPFVSPKAEVSKDELLHRIESVLPDNLVRYVRCLVIQKVRRVEDHLLAV